MSNAHVVPSRIRLHSSDLSCDVVRGVGFRACCGCGWVGPSHDTYAAARTDALRHIAHEPSAAHD